MTPEHKHNSTPLFSIVIPTYNHGHLIGRCLDSVISQTYTNWEAIVVNNFSQDNTVEVVESYGDPRIRLINFTNNGIIAASRNKGISEARGEWICFLDSDDWWTSDKLEACLPHLAGYDMIYHPLIVVKDIETDTPTLTTGGPLPSAPLYENLLYHGNCISNSSVAIRRTIVERIGPLNEDIQLRTVEDFDYWLRIAKGAGRIFCLSQALGNYWVSASSMTASEKNVESILSLYSKHLGSLSDHKSRLKIQAMFDFRLGRSYTLLFGNHAKARRQYRKALRSPEPKIKLKAALLYLLAALHIQR